MTTILVADIGGTKIDFAMLDARRPFQEPLHVEQLASNRFASLAEALAACRARLPATVEYASLAVAGPVVDQQVSFTNLPWQAEAADLARQAGLAGVVLVNDLAALAEGVDLLGEDDLASLKPGTVQAGGNRLVVAPGTGLGAALVLAGGKVQATEAGHLSFAPRSAAETELLTFMHREHDHVSFEMLCSGMGIGNLFDYLQGTGLPVPLEAAQWPREELAPLLARRARAATIHCPLSSCTYEIFFDILAEFCANLTLVSLPAGGIYLGGGMLPHLHRLLDARRFRRRFEARGKMQAVVKPIPVFLINHPHLPLLGAYQVGRRTFLDER
ncbi:MAG: hypothetical protein C0613_12315 [Desulfobulbaceae bacterium]|nr:MAG: hypothetical protein C0613_12315 [Desulfobulbaceae bacterium]